MNTLFPTSYLPPVSYFSFWKKADQRCIEVMEHFPKQSLRNRCTILTANGPMLLTVPVEKGHSHKKFTRDVCISYSENWQQKHWRAIESAYRKAPYFEFYAYRFEAVLFKKHPSLLALNEEFREMICGMVNCSPDAEITMEYATHFDGLDLREFEKTAVHNFTVKPYTQVFSDRFPFYADLSIVDLIMNCGPDSVNHLH